MSDGGEIKNIQENIVGMFEKLFFGLQQFNSIPDDYFSTSTSGDTVKLSSLFDGREYDCPTKKEIQNSMSDIVAQKNMYDNLLNRMAFIDLPEGNREQYFTPQMFNDLGGQHSGILKNVDSIGVSDYGDKKNAYFNFNKDASRIYSGFSISPYNKTNNEYVVGFIYKDYLSLPVRYVIFDSDNLEKEIKDETQLNEKAFLSNKKDGYSFNGEEVPKDRLKQAGLKWKDLSEVQKRDLLTGKETSPVTITVQNGKGQKKFYRGHLQLHRTGATSADFMFRKTSARALKMTLFKS
jgi:hypothetical protein